MLFSCSLELWEGEYQPEQWRCPAAFYIGARRSRRCRPGVRVEQISLRLVGRRHSSDAEVEAGAEGGDAKSGCQLPGSTHLVLIVRQRSRNARVRKGSGGRSIVYYWYLVVEFQADKDRATMVALTIGSSNFDLANRIGAEPTHRSTNAATFFTAKLGSVPEAQPALHKALHQAFDYDGPLATAVYANRSAIPTQVYKTWLEKLRALELAISADIINRVEPPLQLQYSTRSSSSKYAYVVCNARRIGARRYMISPEMCRYRQKELEWMPHFATTKLPATLLAYTMRFGMPPSIPAILFEGRMGMRKRPPPGTDRHHLVDIEGEPER